MHVLVPTVLVLTATLAGCLADDSPTRGLTDGPEPSRDERLNETLAGAPQFCQDDETGIPSGPFAGPCHYWDLEYHEFVLYDLDTYVFDVVIVPPVGLTTPDQIATSRLAVQAWRDGILHYAEPWLAEKFEMNIYAVGIDIPSIDAVQDPEIVVLSTSAALTNGIGLEPAQFACALLDEAPLRDLGGHSHGASPTFAAECTGTGFTCFAINAGELGPRALYDLIAHEVGHCLGAGHVGDALDFRARYAPIEDIMSYQANESQVHCVSNLNVRTLEGVFAHLLDRPEETFLPAGSFYHSSPLDYEQVPCENPPGM